MKQKTVELLHEIRMSIVQIGIPLVFGTLWAIDSGVFDRMRIRMENKKKRKQEEKFIKDYFNADYRQY